MDLYGKLELFYSFYVVLSVLIAIMSQRGQ